MSKNNLACNSSLSPKITKSISATMRGCNRNIINDCDELLRLMTETATDIRATPYGTARAVYVPHGITAVLFLAESHIMLTTWPEYSVVLADMAFCGDINPKESLEILSKKLGSMSVEDVFSTDRVIYL